MFNTLTQLSSRDVLSPFLVYIKFHMIPASVLMTEIHPLGLVPYKYPTHHIHNDTHCNPCSLSLIMNALAYQADPSSVTTEKSSPHRIRKAKIPNRAASIQSSLDPWCGSSTTISSTNSSMTMGSEGGMSNMLNPEVIQTN